MIMDEYNINMLLRKNVDLLESGITIQEYLQKEKDIEINGSTEIYDGFGIYVIYDQNQKFYIVSGGFCTDSRGSIGDFIHEVLNYNKKEYLHHRFLKNVVILKYYRLNQKEYPSIEADNKRYTYEEWQEIEGEHIKFYDVIDRHYKSLGFQSYSGGHINWKLETVANSLLRLQRKSTILYELLNAVVDVIVKPLPVFIWLLVENKSNIFVGENIIQKLLSGMFGITGCF